MREYPWRCERVVGTAHLGRRCTAAVEVPGPGRSAGRRWERMSAGTDAFRDGLAPGPGWPGTGGTMP